MATLFLPLLLIFYAFSMVQTQFPSFLAGTWKIDKKEVYEHWDSLNANTLKGYAYKIVDGKVVVSEYLDIKMEKKQVNYTFQ